MDSWIKQNGYRGIPRHSWPIFEYPKLTHGDSQMKLNSLNPRGADLKMGDIVWCSPNLWPLVGKMMRKIADGIGEHPKFWDKRRICRLFPGFETVVHHHGIRGQWRFGNTDQVAARDWRTAHALKKSLDHLPLGQNGHAPKLKSLVPKENINSNLLNLLGGSWFCPWSRCYCLNLWPGYSQRMLRRERDNAHPSATGSGTVAHPQSEDPAQGLDAWGKTFLFCSRVQSWWLRMFRCSHGFYP